MKVYSLLLEPLIAIAFYQFSLIENVLLGSPSRRKIIFYSILQKSKNKSKETKIQQSILLFFSPSDAPLKLMIFPYSLWLRIWQHSKLLLLFLALFNLLIALFLIFHWH